MSIPQPSTSTGIPPSDVTASTSSRASPLPRADGFDVVAHARRRLGVDEGDHRRVGVGREQARRGRGGRPRRRPHAPPPHRARAATSHMRSPNSPLTPTTTTSPGLTTLTNAASIPAEPVPLTGSVSGLPVREHGAQPVTRLVEHGQEVGIEVAEHRARRVRRRPRDRGWTVRDP